MTNQTDKNNYNSNPNTNRLG